jgi:hypothetical protein
MLHISVRLGHGISVVLQESIFCTLLTTLQETTHITTSIFHDGTKKISNYSKVSTFHIARIIIRNALHPEEAGHYADSSRPPSVYQPSVGRPGVGITNDAKIEGHIQRSPSFSARRALSDWHRALQHRIHAVLVFSSLRPHLGGSNGSASAPTERGKDSHMIYCAVSYG